jgi:hypothetical protein
VGAGSKPTGQEVEARMTRCHKCPRPGRVRCAALICLILTRRYPSQPLSSFFGPRTPAPCETELSGRETDEHSSCGAIGEPNHQHAAYGRIVIGLGFLCCLGCPPDIAVAHRIQDGHGGVSPTRTPCGAKWSNSLVAHQVCFSTPRQPPTHFSLARRQAGPKNLFCTHRNLGRRIRARFEPI